MAKQRKILPARPQREAFDDSLLIRSAESLGRMIGALQREIDAARQFAGVGVQSRRNGQSGRERPGTASPDNAKKTAKKNAKRATPTKARKTAPHSRSVRRDGSKTRRA